VTIVSFSGLNVKAAILSPLFRALLPVTLCLALGQTAQLFGAEDDRAADREALVQELANRRGGASILSAADEDPGIRNPRVLDAIRTVPRHWFVPDNMQRDAYANRPLPIGHGQTISQPLIVAMMTEMLDPQPEDKILEIGTGSGYQAAVLTKFTPHVYTIEIVEPLHREAAPKLQRLGLGEDKVIQGDGYFGLEKAAPFDKIIVTAAADHIPPPLIQQLKPGGRMVIPIGPVHATQRLVAVEKDEAGKVRSRAVLPVRFVPLTGGPRGAEKK
jgi:protein-L-isoaspartate(D-aspartate) O-methyltransferase